MNARGVWSSEIPSYDSIAERARDLRPALRKVRPLSRVPGTYRRPDRFSGGVGRVEKHGLAIDWGKGYRGRNQRQRLAKKRITILSKRVLHPLFTAEKVGEVFHAMIDWVIEGRR